MSRKVDKKNMTPVPWRDFVLGFQVATKALTPPTPVAGTPGAVEGAAEKTREERLAERDPYLLVALRTREHFGELYPHHASFLYRFWALMHLFRRGHITRWVTERDDDRFRSFHPAVLLAAAEVKLTNTAKFPVRQFIARVEQIIEEESGAETA